MNHVVGNGVDRKSTFWKRLVRSLAILYLITLVAIWTVIHFHSRSWWPVTLFLFSPRWTIAVPLLVLVPLTLATQFRLTAMYALHGILIAFCILGYRVSWERQEESHEQQVLKVLTCNLGGGAISTDQLADLVASRNVHVLMLQECDSSVSKPLFQQLGWVRRQEANIAIGSSFELGELRVLATQKQSQYKAVAAISCEIYIPTEPPAFMTEVSASPGSRTVQMVNVHFPTFRGAFSKALRLERDAAIEFGSIGSQYTDAVEQVRQQIHKIDAPVVIAGDFNVPVESVYYRNYWCEYQNAFSQVGTGFGHTKYTRFHGVRIDHVLADSSWNVASATVAAGFGGDHRPVLVELSLNP